MRKRTEQISFVPPLSGSSIGEKRRATAGDERSRINEATLGELGAGRMLAPRFNQFLMFAIHRPNAGASLSLWGR
jgi:hypothetical protein